MLVKTLDSRYATLSRKQVYLPHLSRVQSIAGNPERSIQHCNNRYVDELNHACLYEFNGALYETGHSMFTDWVVSNDH